MALPIDDISINTLIGSGSAVVGNLSVAGFIRIDGDLDGSLEAAGRVIVGEKARIRANITAVSVIVGGIVEGNIVAPEGVHLFSTAAVFGDIITKKLQIDENVVLNGRCLSLQKDEEFLNAKTLWQDELAIRTKSLKR